MNKELLYNEYVVNQKPIKDIAKKFGIGTGSLYFHLNKYKIPLRTKQKHSPYTDEHWLYNEYITKDKLLKVIAKECGVSQSSIVNYLNKFNIQKKHNPEANYKNRDWLYNERFRQHRSSEDIASEFDVDRKTIEYYAKKYKIPTPLKYTEIDVEILCHFCKKPTTKNLQYLNRRIRTGNIYFFCSRKCTDKHHANQMKGENNPNFEGEFHGDLSNPIFSSEARRERTLKIIEKKKVDGSFQDVLVKLQAGHKNFFETPEGKALRHANGINSVKIQHEKGFKSSLEAGVARLLDSLGLKYEEQKEMYFWIVDFYLPDYDLVIEAHGDYWHANPRKYNKNNMTNDQKDRRVRDAQLKAYIQGAKKHNFLVIWEYSFHNCMERVIEDIKKATK
ncbi:hypothetical protein ACQVNO_12760 [Bacillus paranthracis]|uniref:hypothetical protein n=1 Tax=Bacillus paranthracis TaxID=2026186 RepID=UPI00254AE85D|nr:hypothetical protein [Bacillus paranthracis]MDK7491914.1 hypothetical protein [Bacillus paranthracis]